MVEGWFRRVGQMVTPSGHRLWCSLLLLALNSSTQRMARKCVWCVEWDLTRALPCPDVTMIVCCPYQVQKKKKKRKSRKEPFQVIVEFPTPKWPLAVALSLGGDRMMTSLEAQSTHTCPHYTRVPVRAQAHGRTGKLEIMTRLPFTWSISWVLKICFLGDSHLFTKSWSIHGYPSCLAYGY